MKISLKKDMTLMMDYIYVFVLLALSNMVFFGLMYRSFFLCGSMAFLIIKLLYECCYKKRKYKWKIKDNFYMIFILITLSILCLLCTHEYGTSTVRNTYIGHIICIILIFFLSYFMGKERIVDCYINIMVVICVISLFFFSFAILFPQKVYSIPMLKDIRGYYTSIFYTWGWDNYGQGLYVFKRNSGPFWEPGAFQGFIVIAILMCLNINEEIRRLDLKVAILFITLISTQSTTGLLLLICIVFVWKNTIMNIFSLKKRNFRIKVAVVLTFVILVCAWLIKSNIIIDKIMQYEDTSASTGIRLNDFLSSIKLMFIKPFFGLGMGTRSVEKYKSTVGIVNNSNGLFGMIYSMGFIYSIVFILAMVKGLIQFYNCNNILKKIVIIGIFIIIHLTESVYTFPMYMLFLFSYYSEKNKRI